MKHRSVPSWVSSSIQALRRESRRGTPSVFSLLLLSLIAQSTAPPACATPIRPGSQPRSLETQVFSVACPNPDWSDCVTESVQVLFPPDNPDPSPLDTQKHVQFHAKTLGMILTSLNPSVDLLKPGTAAAARVRNPDLYKPLKPMGTRARRAQRSLDVMMRGVESHSLAMVLTAFLLFLCSGVFWVGNKQPEEAPPYPLPERAAPIMLANLRHPPIPLRHSAGVRSFQ